MEKSAAAAAPAPASSASFAKSGDVDNNMKVMINEQDSHDFINMHNVNVVDVSSAASSLSEAFDHTVNVVNGLAGVPVAGAVIGSVAGAVAGDAPAHTDVASALPNLPVAGAVAGTVAGVLPNVTSALPNPASLPAVGAVTEHVTSTVHSLPVVGEVAHSLPLPDVHALPVVGDVASTLPLAHGL